MDSKIVTPEQEVSMLKYAFNCLGQLIVTGPKQAALLAQSGDLIMAVLNSRIARASAPEVAQVTVKSDLKVADSSCSNGCACTESQSVAN